MKCFLPVFKPVMFASDHHSQRCWKGIWFEWLCCPYHVNRLPDFSKVSLLSTFYSSCLYSSCPQYV